MGKGYRFLHGDKLPHGEFSEKKLNNLEKINWAVTGPYCDIAKNHCATVCLTNLYNIYKLQGADLPEKDNDEIFKSVYRFTGNGPIIALGRKARRFFKSIGFVSVMTKARGLEEIEQAIDGDEPVALLVSGGLLRWHWIICVGVRTYADGTKYLNIMENWERNTNWYIKVEGAFTWFRALKFKVAPIAKY